MRARRRGEPQELATAEPDLPQLREDFEASVANRDRNVFNRARTNYDARSDAALQCSQVNSPTCSPLRRPAGNRNHHNIDPRMLFGFGVLTVITVLAVMIAQGKVQQESSYGLEIVLSSLGTLSGIAVGTSAAAGVMA